MSNFNGGFTILVILFVIFAAMFVAIASIVLYIEQRSDIKILEDKLKNEAPASSSLPNLAGYVATTTPHPVEVATTSEAQDCSHLENELEYCWMSKMCDIDFIALTECEEALAKSQTNAFSLLTGRDKCREQLSICEEKYPW